VSSVRRSRRYFQLRRSHHAGFAAVSRCPVPLMNTA